MQTVTNRPRRPALQWPLPLMQIHRRLNLATVRIEINFLVGEWEL